MFEAEFAKLDFDLAQVGAGVHEGAQHHVPTDAGETVEICDTNAFHALSGEILAVRRKNDTSLRAKECQMRGQHAT